ncbi:LysR family transcriptional regulator [Verticiella sediminum]|uniref:LysR family transcriptional regulator n=1 Tax=Verticiella sediminum TaxID=1247510 RepID=UPI001478947F|nr:LysR family transcriptional regulator [Verticiella sediminum]
MSLTYLRLFACIDEIARAGSIRKAAQTLYITPSALDRRLQELEQQIGAPLFERHARGMRVTAAGEIFLHHIRAHRADAERVRTEIEQLKGLQRGTVTLAASQALTFSVLPDALNAFQRDNPGIRVVVRIDSHMAILRALREFAVDVAALYSMPPADDLSVLHVLDQGLCAVMAADHPLAGEPSLRMRQCLQYPLALPDASLGLRSLIDGVIARGSTAPRVMLESNSLEMLRTYVRGNDAISFQIPAGASLERTYDGVVARRIEERGLARRQLTVAQLRGRHLPLAAARFVEVLKARLPA